MSEKEGVNEISTEERIKNLETKANKVESLLTMNIFISLIGGATFFFLSYILGFYSIIFSIFLGIYGILNWIILIKNNQESPK